MSTLFKNSTDEVIKDFLELYPQYINNKEAISVIEHMSKMVVSSHKDIACFINKKFVIKKIGSKYETKTFYLVNGLSTFRTFMDTLSYPLSLVDVKCYCKSYKESIFLDPSNKKFEKSTKEDHIYFFDEYSNHAYKDNKLYQNSDLHKEINPLFGFYISDHFNNIQDTFKTEFLESYMMLHEIRKLFTFLYDFDQKIDLTFDDKYYDVIEICDLLKNKCEIHYLIHDVDFSSVYEEFNNKCEELKKLYSSHEIISISL